MSKLNRALATLPGQVTFDLAQRNDEIKAAETSHPGNAAAFGRLRTFVSGPLENAATRFNELRSIAETNLTTLFGGQGSLISDAEANLKAAEGNLKTAQDNLSATAKAYFTACQEAGLDTLHANSAVSHEAFRQAVAKKMRDRHSLDVDAEAFGLSESGIPEDKERKGDSPGYRLFTYFMCLVAGFIFGNGFLAMFGLITERSLRQSPWLAIGPTIMGAIILWKVYGLTRKISRDFSRSGSKYVNETNSRLSAMSALGTIASCAMIMVAEGMGIYGIFAQKAEVARNLGSAEPFTPPMIAVILLPLVSTGVLFLLAIRDGISDWEQESSYLDQKTAWATLRNKIEKWLPSEARAKDAIGLISEYNRLHAERDVAQREVTRCRGELAKTKEDPTLPEDQLEELTTAYDTYGRYNDLYHQMLAEPDKVDEIITRLAA